MEEPSTCRSRPRRPHRLPRGPAAHPTVGRPGHRPAGPRSPLGLRGALLVGHPRPVHGVAAAAPGRRAGSRARGLRRCRCPTPPAPWASPGRAAATPPSCAPCPLLPVRHGRAARRRARRAPQAPPAHPAPARPPARTGAHEEHAGWSPAPPGPSTAPPSSERARQLALTLLELGEDSRRGRAPAPPLALPPRRGPRRPRLGHRRRDTPGGRRGPAARRRPAGDGAHGEADVTRVRPTAGGRRSAAPPACGRRSRCRPW